MRLLVILSCFLILDCWSQQADLKIIQSGSAPEISYKTRFSSAQVLHKEIRTILSDLHYEGFLLATIDSMKKAGNLHTAFLSSGKKFRWGTIRKGNVPETILSATGFREKLFTGKTLDYRNIAKLQEKILTWYENHGYPFSEVKLDSVEISEEKISASIFADPGKQIRLDSVVIKGNSKISAAYISRYLQVREGELYDESAIRKISRRLRDLPFLKEEKPFEVEFREDYTRLVLYLQKKKASQFDGFAGFLPDNKTGKLLLTGDIRLKLQNAMGRGELFDFNWRKLEKNTQDLRTRLNYPYLFRTPFGIDYELKLLKKDTLYLDVNQTAGVQYLFSGTSYFKVFAGFRNSSLISTEGLEAITVLPAYADVDVKSYGAGLRLEQLDYRLNPSKGFVLDLSGSAGNRKIRKNANLNPVVYDRTDLSSAQFRGNGEAIVFIPLTRRHVLKIAGESGIISGENIFRNELFRIGGLRNLRGFDEESILASWYNIFTAEYRFLLEENSYLHFFWNGAYYEDHSQEHLIHDTPFGIGAGISFETKPGIFSLSYALGKQFGNPIEFRAGKIHFGVVTYF